MKKSCFVGKAFVALGICLVALGGSLGVESAFAGCATAYNAGCVDRVPYVPEVPSSGCSGGVCVTVYIGDTCGCAEDRNAANCKCE